MFKYGHIIVLLNIFLLAFGAAVSAEKKRTLFLDHTDRLNRRKTPHGMVWYGYGNVKLRLDSTHVRSDSVIWYREQDNIHFFGNVEAFDTIQHIRAQKVSYFHNDSILLAQDNVIMVHHRDSIRTESQKAEYHGSGDVVYLEGDPRLYLNYPDTDNMVEITADDLVFYSGDSRGEAIGDVTITQKDTKATGGCAEFDREENMLTLMDEPYAVRGSSDIKGNLMQIRFGDRGIERIDVFEDAEAFFVEEGDSLAGELPGESSLSGNDITFHFQDEQVRKISAIGSARSKYFPSPDDTTGAGKNFVSGDSIFIYINYRKITKAEVKGGAEGAYITERERSDTVISDSLEQAAALPADSLLPDSLIDVALAKTDTVEIDTMSAGPVDSLPEDITSADSTAAPDSLASIGAPEDSILYRGDYLEYFAKQRIIRITGNSRVRQGDVILNAHRIDYDIPRQIVLAHAGIDSLDSIVDIKPLSLKDGSEEMHGSKLVFNVDTKKGLIEDATTQYERAYYRGRDLHKEDEKVFYVQDGVLTSCELEQPHFHFRSKKMKLIHNDRVIARPVTFYIETLPVMRVPYYVFPLKRGRHSGILPIKLGNFEKGSRYIGNLGYYWAASEYWDIQASLDFFENTGINLKSLFRYKKLYAYDGTISGSYARNRRDFAFGESGSDDWKLQGNHKQTLPYEINFGASGSFVSSKGYTDNYDIDPIERRNRILISKANFRKSFGKGSLSLSFSHTNNIDTDSRNATIPQGSLSLPSFHPFGSGREVGGKTIKKWYNHIYLGYRNSFKVFTKRDKLTDGSRTKKEYAYIDHSMSLSASQKILKYISIGPSVSMRETWYYILPTDQAHAAGIPANRPYRRGAISAAISSNTNLYGTFPINLFGLMALRHVFSPSVRFGWSPAVTKNDVVRSYVGVGGGGGKSKNLSLSVQNLFQAKIKTGEQEKKLDLLRIGSGLSYNFEATVRKFSNLNTSIRSSLLKNVNLSGNLVHDLYDDEDNLQLWSPRLKSFSIQASFQARGSVSDSYGREDLGSPSPADTIGTTPAGLGVDLSAPPASGSAAWNAKIAHHYSESRLSQGIIAKTHWIDFTFNLNLTTNWKLRYSQKYDFVRHKTIDKIIDLTRQIHCWEGHFYWIPDGSGKGFYFKINVIAIPDIKLEKSESGLRGALLDR